MYKKIVLSLFIVANAATSLKAQDKHSNLHLGFIYPVSSNGKVAAEYTNKFSLHLLGGISYSEQAASIVGMASKVKNDVRGAHMAGLGYAIGNKADGALLSGVFNCYKYGTGAYMAGVANLAKGNVGGVQLSGVINQSGKLDGSQISGIVNLAKDSMQGAQITGIVNKADNVKGLQLAGVANLAKKVKGVQIAGIVNIADSSDYPIALINLIKNGEKSIGLSVDEQATALVSFRSGGRVLYGILGLGYNFKNDKEVYAIQAGLGAHLISGDKFGFNVEAVNVSLQNFKRGDYFKSSLVLMPTYKIDKKLALFAGASLNYMNTNTEEGKDLTKKFIFSWDGKAVNNLQGVFVGGTVGLKYKL